VQNSPASSVENEVEGRGQGEEDEDMEVLVCLRNGGRGCVWERGVRQQASSGSEEEKDQKGSWQQGQISRQLFFDSAP
jgi:hypothetical protein